MRCSLCHRESRNLVLIAGAFFGPKCALKVKAPKLSLWQRIKARAVEILSAWRKAVHL